MANKQINTIGSVGLNTDIDPWNLPDNAISYANNFRVLDDKLQSFNGITTIATPGANFYGGKLAYIYSQGNAYYIVLGRTKVKQFDGSLWTDISSVAGYAGLGANDELKWTYDKLGKALIINNPQATVEYWYAAIAACLPLPYSAGVTWTAKGYKANVFRAHKNFLFALYLTEGVSVQPYSYRWSHPADINGVPFTWEEADLSAIAGKSQLSGSGGEIIDGKSLRDDFIIYSEHSINALSYTGDEFVWSARPLSNSYGLLAIDCLVEVKGIHYFIAEGDILYNDGSNIESILSMRMRRKLAASLSTTYFYNCEAIVQTNKNEIWFCIVEQGYTLPNIAYIYNYENKSLAIRDIDSTIAGKVYAPIVATPETWDSDATLWDADVTTWGTNQYSLFNAQILGIKPSDTSIVSLETNDGTTNMGTAIERTGLMLEDGIVSVVRVYIKATCVGSFNIQLGSQDEAGGSVTWKQTLSFNPNTDRSAPLRASGRYICYKITSIGSVKFSISSMSFDYELVGGR